MREAEFQAWMEAEDYSKATVQTQIADVRRLDKAYGNLDDLPNGQTLASIRASLEYSKADERVGKPNPCKFEIDGDLYANLAHYRAALNFYQRFLDGQSRLRTGSTYGLTPRDILDAIDRCDSAGSAEALIARHEGLGQPSKFWLLHRGKRYPSEAIVHSALTQNESDALPNGVECKAALDALGFVVIDWPEFESLRKAFLTRVTGFVDFRRQDGSYWTNERRYKNQKIEKVRILAASSIDDRTSGEQICRTLSDQGPLSWRTLDEVQKADAALRDRFYEVVAKVARSDDDPLATIASGAKALEQLRVEGIAGLRRGEVLAIAISVVGTVHPEAASWFKVSRMEQMAQRLFGRKLFAHPQFEPADLDEYLQLMRELFTLLATEAGWNPADLFDVQGFLWVALDDKWSYDDPPLQEDGGGAVKEPPASPPVKRSPLNLILYGPPGTGKTYRTMAEAVRLCRGLADDDTLLADPARRQELRKAYDELRSQERIGFVTFHQNYAYEDFVEGLRPKPLADGVGFTLVAEPGILRRMAEAAEASPEGHVLVIDEINRANISKVFGELITLVEPDKRLGMDEQMRLTLPYSGARFGMPANLHIVGTMNTADRSIALLDTALRRRFEFRELMPDISLLGTVDGIDLAAMLATINERIEYLFDREHQIGHAYFIRCRSRADLDQVMRYKVIPLLAEYFYDDWAKVAAVLGDGDDSEGSREGGFIDRRQLKAPNGMGGDEDAVPRYRWSVRDSFTYDRLIGE